MGMKKILICFGLLASIGVIAIGRLQLSAPPPAAGLNIVEEGPSAAVSDDQGEPPASEQAPAEQLLSSAPQAVSAPVPVSVPSAPGPEPLVQVSEVTNPNPVAPPAALPEPEIISEPAVAKIPAAEAGYVLVSDWLDVPRLVLERVNLLSPPVLKQDVQIQDQAQAQAQATAVRDSYQVNEARVSEPVAAAIPVPLTALSQVMSEIFYRKPIPVPEPEVLPAPAANTRPQADEPAALVTVVPVAALPEPHPEAASPLTAMSQIISDTFYGEPIPVPEPDLLANPSEATPAVAETTVDAIPETHPAAATPFASLSQVVTEIFYGKPAPVAEPDVLTRSSEALPSAVAENIPQADDAITVITDVPVAVPETHHDVATPLTALSQVVSEIFDRRPVPAAEPQADEAAAVKTDVPVADIPVMHPDMTHPLRALSQVVAEIFYGKPAPVAEPDVLTRSSVASPAVAETVPPADEAAAVKTDEPVAVPQAHPDVTTPLAALSQVVSEMFYPKPAPVAEPDVLTRSSDTLPSAVSKTAARADESTAVNAELSGADLPVMHPDVATPLRVVSQVVSKPVPVGAPDGLTRSPAAACS